MQDSRLTPSQLHHLRLRARIISRSRRLRPQLGLLLGRHLGQHRARLWNPRRRTFLSHRPYSPRTKLTSIHRTLPSPAPTTTSSNAASTPSPPAPAAIATSTCPTAPPTPCTRSPKAAPKTKTTAPKTATTNPLNPPPPTPSPTAPSQTTPPPPGTAAKRPTNPRKYKSTDAGGGGAIVLEAGSRTRFRWGKRWDWA